MKEFKTFSEKQTADVALSLGKILKQGDVICLSGDLGTGKTAFTRGIAWALGINEHITSPTFTIVNEYRGIMPLYHFDVYRVGDSEEMFEIGFEEYIYGSGVTVIEWAELISDVLPHEYIRVEIKKDLSSGVDARVVIFEFRGDRYEGYEERLDEG